MQHFVLKLVVLSLLAVLCLDAADSGSRNNSLRKGRLQKSAKGSSQKRLPSLRKTPSQKKSPKQTTPPAQSKASPQSSPSGTSPTQSSPASPQALLPPSPLPQREQLECIRLFNHQWRLEARPLFFVPEFLEFCVQRNGQFDYADSNGARYKGIALNQLHESVQAGNAAIPMMMITTSKVSVQLTFTVTERRKMTSVRDVTYLEKSGRYVVTDFYTISGDGETLTMRMGEIDVRYKRNADSSCKVM